MAHEAAVPFGQPGASDARRSRCSLCSEVWVAAHVGQSVGNRCPGLSGKDRAAEEQGRAWAAAGLRGEAWGAGLLRGGPPRGQGLLASSRGALMRRWHPRVSPGLAICGSLERGACLGPGDPDLRRPALQDRGFAKGSAQEQALLGPGHMQRGLAAVQAHSPNLGG